MSGLVDFLAESGMTRSYQIDDAIFEIFSGTDDTWGPSAMKWLRHGDCCKHKFDS